MQIDYLCERLLYMYEDGMDVSYLEVLFSATNIRDFLTRYDLLQYVVEQDMNLIDTINKNKRALDIKKNDLEIQKKNCLPCGRFRRPSEGSWKNRQSKNRKSCPMCG